jgi:homocitrate synthase NifV
MALKLLSKKLYIDGPTKSGKTQQRKRRKDMKPPIHLIDTTLREGEQTVGIHFTTVQKKEIIRRLALVGVSEIEMGIASPFTRDLAEIMTFCRDNHPGINRSLWSRCLEKDIVYASTLRPEHLSLSIPVSDLHLDTKLGKDRTWAKQTMMSAIRLAVKEGLKVSVGFEDATRADQEFLVRMARIAEDHGAFRVRLADTVGLATPFQIISLVGKIKKALRRCDVAIHTHNDFGMATANAMTALESGATWADATILGLGERSGCARLEELAGYLGMIYSDTRIQAQHLKPLAGYVAGITNRTIEDARPVLGEKIFACETGLHLQGLLKDPATYEPYPPERVGAKRHLLIGAKCGRNAIKSRLAALGVEIDEGPLLQKTRALRDRAVSFGKTLDDAEILSIMLPA